MHNPRRRIAETIHVCPIYLFASPFRFPWISSTRLASHPSGPLRQHTKLEYDGTNAHPQASQKFPESSRAHKIS